MKVVILAGGHGTRLAEETKLLPKPMVEIGGKPILMHVMEFYARFGFKDFIIACGYKGHVIKDYFRSLSLGLGDWTIALRSGKIAIKDATQVPDWNVTLVDTGLDTMTGGRILRLRDYLGGETFMVTYGDGVGNVDIDTLIKTHRDSGRTATLTAVHPPARFGSVEIDGTRVSEFHEKAQTREGWINGGFMVFEPKVFDYLTGDACVLERDGLEKLAAAGQLSAHRHFGFWHPMDTLRDKTLLDDLCKQGRPPWTA